MRNKKKRESSASILYHVPKYTFLMICRRREEKLGRERGNQSMISATRWCCCVNRTRGRCTSSAVVSIPVLLLCFFLHSFFSLRTRLFASFFLDHPFNCTNTYVRYRKRVRAMTTITQAKYLSSNHHFYIPSNLWYSVRSYSL